MLERIWYRDSMCWTAWLLWPLSFVFARITSFRRFLYRVGILKTYHFDVPLIVVGNVTVGGTGKTPFTIWLANFLKSEGYSPAIISRGYGGEKSALPRVVRADSKPNDVGDEALMIERNTFVPMVVGRDRVACARKILAEQKCDVIIADDGLQHYRLGRQIEIALVDGVRQFGNECHLPAGPLREPVSRLKRVNFIVKNNGDDADMYLVPNQVIALKTGVKKTLANFKGGIVHAVAAIGHPERFFQELSQAGLRVIPHAFPDHYQFKRSDFQFNDSYPILMTEKDAVKCEDLHDDRLWYVSVTAKISDDLSQALLACLKEKRVKK